MAAAITSNDEVYQFVKGYFLARGYPPSIREIASYFGYNTTSAPARRLQQLVDDGRLTLVGRGPGAMYTIPRDHYSIVMEENL